MIDCQLIANSNFTRSIRLLAGNSIHPLEPEPELETESELEPVPAPAPSRNLLPHNPTTP